MNPRLHTAPSLYIPSGRINVVQAVAEFGVFPSSFPKEAWIFSARAGGISDVVPPIFDYLVDSPNTNGILILPYYRQRVEDNAEKAGMSDAEVRELRSVLEREHGLRFLWSDVTSGQEKPYVQRRLHNEIEQSLGLQQLVANEIWRLRAQFHGEKMVVHLHDQHFGAVAGLLPATGIPTIQTVHNSLTMWIKNRKILRRGLDIEPIKDEQFYSHLPEPGSNWQDWSLDMNANAVWLATHSTVVSPGFAEDLANGTLIGIEDNDYRRKQVANLSHAVGTRMAEGRVTPILNGIGDSSLPYNTKGIIKFWSEREGEHRGERILDVYNGKKANKKATQEALGLDVKEDVPLIVWTHRLADQKGTKEFLEALPYILDNTNAQIAIVADGTTERDKEHEDKYIPQLMNILGREAYRGRAKRVQFNAELSDLANAGADFLLHPARYAPCEVAQMKALRAGTLPIARNTGGLRDTVENIDLQRMTGNGIVYDELSSEGLIQATTKAVAMYNNKQLWSRVQQMQPEIMRKAERRFSARPMVEKYDERYGVVARKVA